MLDHNPEECLILVDGFNEWEGSPTSETGRRGDIRGLPTLAGVENCCPYYIQTMNSVDGLNCLV